MKRKKQKLTKKKYKIIRNVVVFLLLIVLTTTFFIIKNKNKAIATFGQVEQIGNSLKDIDLEKKNEILVNTSSADAIVQTFNKAIDESLEYYIKVNNTTNTVIIYTKDDDGYYTIPERTMTCSTGRATPLYGKYTTPGMKNRWHTLFGHTPGTYVYGQYITQITGNILFHSVPYTRMGDPSSLEYWEFDKLGTEASAGCIRLTVEDAKWIYDNVRTGTTVEFYCDNDPGPLGKPEVQKISDNTECRGWDPTDPDNNNPWKKGNS